MQDINLYSTLSPKPLMDTLVLRKMLTEKGNIIFDLTNNVLLIDAIISTGQQTN